MDDNRISDIDLLRRFLVFGRDDGIYQARSESSVDGDSRRRQLDLIDRLSVINHGEGIISMLLEYSKDGRTLSKEPLMFCLAACSLSSNESLRRTALTIMPSMCKDATPTYLFTFLYYRKQLSGSRGRWGRAMRRAISQYYNSYRDDPMKLALHVTKFGRRLGWSHMDVLRLAHVKSYDMNINYILAYISRGLQYADMKYPNANNDAVLRRVKDYLRTVTDVRQGRYANREAALCGQIASKQLVPEQLNTQSLRSARVWETLLVLMPMKCMLRNLGKMASLNLFGDNKPAENGVLRFLRCDEKIEDSKVHPIDVLVAYHQYCKRESEQQRITWIPREPIKIELEEAFYRSFGNVEPTGKRYLLAVDLGSNHTTCVKGIYGDLKIGKYIASLLLALHKVENRCQSVAFGTTEVRPLEIENNSRIENTENIWLRGVTTHHSCLSVLMNYAIRNNLEVDIFVVFSGGNERVLSQAPLQRLEEYRHRSGIDARLAFVNMMGDNISVQHTNITYARDIMGFDSKVLSAIQEFARS